MRPSAQSGHIPERHMLGRITADKGSNLAPVSWELNEKKQNVLQSQQRGVGQRFSPGRSVWAVRLFALGKGSLSSSPHTRLLTFWTQVALLLLAAARALRAHAESLCLSPQPPSSGVLAGSQGPSRQ